MSVAVITATLLEIIDTTIVNVSLPNIQGNFGVGVDLGAWVVTGVHHRQRRRYSDQPVACRSLRAPAVFLQLDRHLYDRVADVRAFAQLRSVGILADRFKGLGGGGLIATSQAILRDTYGIKEQGKAQGIFAMGVIVGPALGPVIGGWITDNWNWHWIFFINIPVGIIAATLIWIFLRNPAEPQYRKLDWIGLILLVHRLGLDAVRARARPAVRLVRRRATFGCSRSFRLRAWRVRLVDAALQDSGRRSAGSAVAPGRCRKYSRRRSRREPLRLDHHLAAISS